MGASLSLTWQNCESIPSQKKVARVFTAASALCDNKDNEDHQMLEVIPKQRCHGRGRDYSSLTAYVWLDLLDSQGGMLTLFPSPMPWEADRIIPTSQVRKVFKDAKWLTCLIVLHMNFFLQRERCVHLPHAPLPTRPVRLRAEPRTQLFQLCSLGFPFRIKSPM